MPSCASWSQVHKYTRLLKVRKGFRYVVSFATSHVYIKREASFRQTFGILIEGMFLSASFHDWRKKERAEKKEQRSARYAANNIKTKLNSNLLFVHQHTPSESTAHGRCAFNTSDIRCPCVLLISTEHKVSGDKHSVCEQVLHPFSWHRKQIKTFSGHFKETLTSEAVI